VHRPGLLPTAVSCARLFPRVERTKVSNSSYLFTRSPYTWLFPAFSSLVHFEMKTKQYFRGKFTQRFASTWPIAYRCELRASVCTCGENQGVEFELFTRSPYTRLFPAFASSCTSKGRSNNISGLIHSRFVISLAYCRLLLAARVCSHVWRGPRCRIRVIHEIPVYAALSGL